MKRIILFLIVIFALVGLMVLMVRPVIRLFAQRELGDIFTDAEVSVRDCRFDPLHRLSFLNVRVQRGEIYDVAVGEVSLHYSLSSLWEKYINDVRIKDVDVRVDLSQKSVLTYGQYLNLGEGGAFSLKTLSFSDVHLDVRSKEFQLKGKVAADLDVEGKILKTVSLEVNSLKSGETLLKEGCLKVDESPTGGEFYVRAIRYDKVGVKDIKGTPRMEGKNLTVQSLSVQAYGGEITGDLFVNIGQVPEYKSDLTIRGVGLEGLLKDLELTEKFEMTGEVNGTLAVSGKGTDVDILSGDFVLAPSGGILTVKDKRFLEHMAKSTNQPLDILVESFKQYHYNNGNAALSLKKKSIVLDLALEGEAGKRNLNITLHDMMQERSPR